MYSIRLAICDSGLYSSDDRDASGATSTGLHVRYDREGRRGDERTRGRRSCKSHDARKNANIERIFDVSTLLSTLGDSQIPTFTRGTRARSLPVRKHSKNRNCVCRRARTRSHTRASTNLGMSLHCERTELRAEFCPAIPVANQTKCFAIAGYLTVRQNVQTQARTP